MGGMHCHQSLVKDGVNLFTGKEYGGLSQTALYYIGGIMKHARDNTPFPMPPQIAIKDLCLVSKLSDSYLFK